MTQKGNNWHVLACSALVIQHVSALANPLFSIRDRFGDTQIFHFLENIHLFKLMFAKDRDKHMKREGVAGDEKINLSNAFARSHIISTDYSAKLLFAKVHFDHSNVTNTTNFSRFGREWSARDGEISRVK